MIDFDNFLKSLNFRLFLTISADSLLEQNFIAWIQIPAQWYT